MINKKELYEWCKIPVEDLGRHKTKVPFRVVEDSEVMGELMARELVDEIEAANRANRIFRAIIPCGPRCWYESFIRIVNNESVSLKNFEVFHMDECLDWEGNLLAKNDPHNFRSFMETHFYGGVREELAVPSDFRHFLEPANMFEIKEMIEDISIDYTLGGWGQDGHIAYNQTRRHPFSNITIEDLINSSVRIQDNNIDTVITLGQRSFGGAYQFVPPMSVTLGIKECLSAKKVRLYSDTGTWKQTAFRVALFSEVTAEYSMTLLQKHTDALITATIDTARHPISENPDWEFKGVNV